MRSGGDAADESGSQPLLSDDGSEQYEKFLPKSSSESNNNNYSSKGLASKVQLQSVSGSDLIP
jgi:hypothetical protein